ncbi:hypothetical protein QUF31_08310 [Dickeya chrysanthemi]|uniref:hypothetical protein n=1 Tax=Dickeya chrysanthemi TaxID=556 RepID=UPI00259FEFC7|nr:hypothetical protein [Dickeya chrysanthemi]WJM87074.1 hypothetical protein QUF31_08310 [Dickeya chrysanthemi]
MRDQTRSYTTDLPRINLQFLTHLRHKLSNAAPNAQVYCDTESGRLYLSRYSDDYSATINGVTRRIGITATRVRYGVREWYVCPHCGERAAKLYIGCKDIGCRKCWHLHYASQSKDEADRLLLSVRKQRRAIWRDDFPPADNLLNPAWRLAKPARMRGETFERKLARLIKTEAAYWRVSDAKMARVTKKLIQRYEKWYTSSLD